MTHSRSNTPLADRNELHESVQELDKLLEDLKRAQVCDPLPHQQQHYYSSTSSLNVAGGSQARPGGSRAGSALSPTPLQKLAASQNELDIYTSRLQSELNKDLTQDTIPRGVFVKDVVEEEILVDHVLVPPKAQHVDAQKQQKQHYTHTKPSDRRLGHETRSSRQVVFRDDSETYDNTDTDEASNVAPAPSQPSAVSRRFARDAQSASQLSLNSATTDQSEMTETSSILDQNKVINCYTCGGRVLGQVITALGRNYHKEHFTCAHCHQELGTRNFYERDNNPYCEKDYQALFSPKCAACAQPILDKVTIALDQTFHPEHFVCAHCGCQFDADEGFHEKDGRPYCKNDFFELFANKCAGCNTPITANYITALGVQWHPDCFVCSECHCPFADGKFFDIDGAPYCEIHYHARRGSLCAVCRQPIIGKCITAMFRKFHPDHFTCTYCLIPLTKSFKEENDKPYCHECFDKLYS